MHHDLSILIEGIGGIGGPIAARLIMAGRLVTLVTHNPAIAAAINSGGLRFITNDPKTPYPVMVLNVHACTTLAEAVDQGPFDAALLCMKATSVVDAARETLPHMAPGGLIVTLQNGLVADAVQEALDPADADRVVGGIAAWGGTMHEPGLYEQTSPGTTFIGELDGSGISDRLRILANALRPIGPITISRNMRGVLWGKLAITCAINPVGAISGQTLAAVLRDPAARQIVLQAYREVVDTADALGIRLEKVTANPRLLYLPKNAPPPLVWFKDLIVQIVGRRYGAVKVSTLQSLERGRRTEIDYLNGYLVAQAEAAGINVPANRALLRMIHQIEAQARASTPANIAAVAADLSDASQR
jgi:2-dehydropantoate 2-reductase